MRRLLPCGEDAVLVECPDGDDARSLWRRLLAHPEPGVDDLALGARTVLVCGEVGAALRRRLLTLAGEAAAPQDSGSVTIPVRYDGADLDSVAEATRLDRDEVIRRHAGTAYTVAFAGFVPGFAYLTQLDPGLRLPRRPDPRTRVPAGSVAIAEGYTAVYPRAGPGGWHLLGSADVDLFDAGREPPAILRPGMRVRFEVA